MSTDNIGIPTTQMLNNMISTVLGQTSNFKISNSFHRRAKLVASMINTDSTGLVTSLTDFTVSSSDVDFYVNSYNDNLNKIIEKYFEIFNIDWVSQGVSMGIKGLSEQFYREYYQGATFPILKYTGTIDINGYKFPKNLYFLNGSSVYAKKENKEDKAMFRNKYTVGRDGTPVGPNSIISKPFSRWGDDYPNPLLIRRGTYNSWVIVDAIKSKQINILDKIIPLMMVIKRGNDKMFEAGTGLTTEQTKDLQQAFNEIIKHRNSSKVATRATSYDEDVEQVIPNIKAMFERELLAGAEKSILTSLGFIDVADSTSSSRRESILNPKAFISQVEEGIKYFEHNFLKPLMYIIKELNKEEHPKMFNQGFHIGHSKPQQFLNEEMRKILRSCYDRGALSKRTYTEVVADMDYDTEKYLRMKEAKSGDEILMSPQATQAQENQPKGEKDVNDDSRVDLEKVVEEKSGPEKIGFENAMLKNLDIKKDELPKEYKNILSSELKQQFIEEYKENLESYKEKFNIEEAKALASRDAWEGVNAIGEMTKKGLVKNHG